MIENNHFFKDKPYLYYRVFRVLEAEIRENFTRRTEDEIFALLAQYLKFKKEGRNFEFSLLSKSVTITNRIKNVSKYIQPLLCFQWPVKVINSKKKRRRAA